MKTRSFMWSILFFIGLVSLFVGERLVGVGALRTAFGAAGGLLIVGSTVVRALRMLKAQGDARRVERMLLLFAVVGIASLALYALQSDVWAKLAGAGLDKTAPKLDGALAALWPALLGLALFPTFFAEMAYASMHRAPLLEAMRVRDAALSGVGIASVLVFAFCAYYVAAERDVKADLSYFRTTRAGDATQNLVRALDQPVEVSAFFPSGNEVREQVSEYLSDLQKLSPNFVVQFYDHALEPTLAKELGVTGNGTLVVKRKDRRELMGFGLELERARSQLRTLDADFQKRLLQVSRGRKTLYFTTGHGERAPDRMTSTDQRWTMRLARELLGNLNYDVRNLGVAEGLGATVPEDAVAVAIVGPNKPFLPEEIASIKKYLDGGGRLLLALDPDAGLTFEDLLGPYGLAYRAEVLANDIATFARTRQQSDRVNIVTAAYSSHPSVTSAGRLGQRAPLLLVSSGFLERTDHKPEGLRVDFTVRSHPMTWSDKNANFTNDADEPRRTFDLAAAVSQTREGGAETRLLVFADSDLFGDPVIEFLGNAYLTLDGVKWLAGEESLMGEVNTEEDKPIQHTRKQDVAWFYSTVFAAPALVLGVGFVVTRRKGRARRKDAQEATR